MQVEEQVEREPDGQLGSLSTCSGSMRHGHIKDVPGALH